jgi:hypothetical protein
MGRICVVTADGRSYYAIVSKLRTAGLPFLSLLPADDPRECGLVITTKREAASFGAPTISLEELDENPDVARSQILARLTEGEQQTMVVGIDPGSRIGTVAFLGETRLASRTFNSKRGAVAWINRLVERVPSKRLLVRVGDGEPGTAMWLADSLASLVPRAAIEMVDESGTSRSGSARGLQKDQGSAARIAFRKGVVFRKHDRASRNR